MKTPYQNIRQFKIFKACIAIAVTAALLTCAGTVSAYSKGMRKQMITGPYEILVKKGLEGDDLIFPVDIKDTARQQKLDKVLPVVGSALKVKVEQFIPNLTWQQYAEPSKDGGYVVRLRAKGPDVDQEIWLDSGDIAKRNITSIVGGVAVKQLRGKQNVEDAMKMLVKPDSIGLLTVWTDESKAPVEFVISQGKEFNLPGNGGTFKVLRYLPHYSIDTETKDVKNASDNPYNPAIEISYTDGKISSKQWFYSRFPAHPHLTSKIPHKVEFTAFDLAAKEGKYVITTGDKVKPKMLWVKDGKKVMKELTINTPYPMTKKGYNFFIEEIVASAALKERWNNKSNELLNPALIVSVGIDDDQRQLVLKLGASQHVKFDSGTVVLLYKKKAPPEPGK